MIAENRTFPIHTCKIKSLTVHTWPRETEKSPKNVKPSLLHNGKIVNSDQLFW